MSPEAALVVEMGAQRQAFHSLVRVRCTPMSRDGSADAASAISRNHGPGTITEPHVTSPRAARSRKALFAPWRGQRSSTWGTTARLNGRPSARSIKVIARSRGLSFPGPFPTNTWGAKTCPSVETEVMIPLENVAVQGDRIVLRNLTGEQVKALPKYTSEGSIYHELGRVDGFDDDEAKSECDEGCKVLVRFLATERNALEALELADQLLDTGAGSIECLREERWPVLGR